MRSNYCGGQGRLARQIDFRAVHKPASNGALPISAVGAISVVRVESLPVSI